ncbi:hypothetical protein Q8A73_007127 [Channa argus]|nr:hypothetical protein Q8A73_007127 [Channa argus]
MVRPDGRAHTVGASQNLFTAPVHGSDLKRAHAHTSYKLFVSSVTETALMRSPPCAHPRKVLMSLCDQPNLLIDALQFRGLRWSPQSASLIDPDRWLEN